MDIIINYVKQVNFIIGLIFTLIGIIVGVFKQYWLIAGLNTKTGSELAEIDLDYVTKYFGIFFGVLGLFLMLCPLVFNYFEVNENEQTKVIMIAVVSVVLFIPLYFNVIKRKRVYKKYTVRQSQSKDVPKKKWRKFIPITIVAAVFLFIYTGYMEPRVAFETDIFKIKGRYGVNIQFSEIVENDTIAWNEMPATRRIIGISTFNVNRGKFKTTDGGKIHLSTHYGVSPVIRIVETNGSVYYINRKNATETRQIFKKLNIDN